MTALEKMQLFAQTVLSNVCSTETSHMKNKICLAVFYVLSHMKDKVIGWLYSRKLIGKLFFWSISVFIEVASMDFLY